MGYGRIPDTFPFASEVVAAGNAAIGLYCRLLAWAAGNKTDGFVPTGIANMIGSRKELDALTRVGMIEPVVAGDIALATGRVGKKPELSVAMPEDGYWLSDYLTYNIAALEAAELTARGRKAGLASALTRSSDSQSQQGVQQQAEQEVDQHVNEEFNRQVKSGQVKSPKIKPSVMAKSESSLDASGDRDASPGGSLSFDQNDAREAGADDQGEMIAAFVAKRSSDPSPIRAAVVAATRREMRTGIPLEIAALIGQSAVMGDRLDPRVGAPILGFADRLLDDGKQLRQAIVEARATFAASAQLQERA